MPRHVPLLFCALFTVLLSACSKSEDDFLAEGRQALTQQEPEKALIAFRNAVQKAPESAAARIALGQSFEAGGRLGDAEEQFTRALELGAKPDELLPRVVVLALENEEPGVVLRKYGKSTLDDPAADGDLRAALATAALADRKPADARRYLEGAKQATPAVRLAAAQLDFVDGKREQALASIGELARADALPWQVWRGIARLYSVAGDEPRALAASEKAYRALPGHPELQAALAEAYLAQGKIEEGRKLRDRLMQAAPKHYRSQFIDAYLKLQEGRLEEAHTQALRVLAAMPDHYPAAIVASKIELGRGESASAEARARKAIGLRDTALEGYRLLSEALLAQNKAGEAVTWIRRGLVLAPEDERLLTLNAEALWQTNRRNDAVAIMDKLRSRLGDKLPPQAAVRLAEMRFALGQQTEALALLKEAEQRAGTHTALRERIFQVALRSGQHEHARQMAEAEIAAKPRDPAPRMWLASLAGSAGQRADALAHTQAALDLQADYYPALLALRAAAKSEEEKQQVQARLDKAIAAKSTDPRIYLDAAIMLRATNAAPDKVIAVIEQGIAAAPKAVALRESATNHWLSLKQPDKAIAVAQEGLAAAPDSPAMEALLASVLQAGGDNQQATRLFGQLIARYPDQPSLYLRQAEALARAGQVGEAVDLMKKAVSLFGDDLSVHTTLAALQLQQGKPEDALTTISILRDRKTWAPQGYIMQGDVFTQTRRYDDALKSYAQAAGVGAEGPAQLRRISVLDLTNDGIKGDRELAAWLKAHPDDLTALQFGAQRAAKRNDHKTAIEFLNRLNQLSPGHASVLNDLAWQKLQLGDRSALADARAAHALAPDAPAVLDTLGMALALSGERQEGIAMLRKAHQLAQNSPDIRIHLAQQLALGGDKSEARQLVGDLDPAKLAPETRQNYDKLKSQL